MMSGLFFSSTLCNTGSSFFRPVLIFRSSNTFFLVYLLTRQTIHIRFNLIYKSPCRVCLNDGNGHTSIGLAARDLGEIERGLWGYHRPQIVCVQVVNELCKVFVHVVQFLIVVFTEVLNDVLYIGVMEDVDLLTCSVSEATINDFNLSSICL